jgi:hypothetical protein
MQAVSMREGLQQFLAGLAAGRDRAPGDPQVAALLQFFDACKALARDSSAILDFGAGHGHVPRLLDATWRERPLPRYVAIDRPAGLDLLALPTRVHNNSLKISTDEFYAGPLQVPDDAILAVTCVNVLHELPIEDMALLITALARFPSSARIFISDVGFAPADEDGNAGWDSDGVQDTLRALGFSVEMHVFSSRSKLPLYGLNACAPASRVNFEDLRDRLTALRLRQIETYRSHLKETRLDPDKVKESRLLRLGISAIERQVSLAPKPLSRSPEPRRSQSEPLHRDLENLVTRYYSCSPLRDNVLRLVDAEHGERDLAFLTRQSWLSNSVYPVLDVALRLLEGHCKAPIDQSFIAEQRADGRRLDDNPTYMLRNVEGRDGKLVLEFNLGTYFQFVSTCLRVDAETRQLPAGETPLRDSLGTSFEAMLGPGSASPLGITVAIVYRYCRNWHVILQQRSTQVASGSGLWVPVPSFAMQPLMKGREQEELHLRHNFFREVAEELYDQLELRSSDGEFDYQWFYDSEPIRSWLHHDTMSALSVVGFGFDGMNLEPNLAAVAKIENADFLTSRTLARSFETQDQRSFRLGSPELIDFVRQGRLHPLGLVALVGAHRLCDVTFPFDLHLGRHD